MMVAQIETDSALAEMVKLLESPCEVLTKKKINLI